MRKLAFLPPINFNNDSQTVKAKNITIDKESLDKANSDKKKAPKITSDYIKQAFIKCGEKKLFCQLKLLFQ